MLMIDEYWGVAILMVQKKKHDVKLRREIE